jgi:hypothetical protein
VFLQEIWFEKDYDLLANCLKENYYIADYDRLSCGAANEVRIDITESSSTHLIIATLNYSEHLNYKFDQIESVTFDKYKINSTFK